MQNNVKVAVAILAVVAGFSVWQFYGAVNGALPGLSVAVVTPDPTAPDNDADQDGLSNEEESYWNTDPIDPDTDGDGFKDGEEVASGHDPTVPGPDDELIPDGAPQNVTKKVANLVLAGLTEGSLKQGGENRDIAVESLVDDIIIQTQTNAGDVGTNKLVIVPDTPAADASYAKQMTPFLKEVAEGNARDLFGMAQAVDSYLNSENPNDLRFVSFFDGELSRIDQRVQRLQAVPVPQRWAIAHNQLLFLIKKSRGYYALIRKIPDDPIQALVAMSYLSDVVLDALPDAIQTFKSLRQ